MVEIFIEVLFMEEENKEIIILEKMKNLAADDNFSMEVSVFFYFPYSSYLS